MTAKDRNDVLDWLNQIVNPDDVDWREFYSDSEICLLAKNTLVLLNQQENDIHHMGLIIEEYEKELKKQEVKETPRLLTPEEVQTIMLKEREGLILALGQSNAANEYLNAEVERLTGLLKEQGAMEPIEEFRKGANCHVYHCKRCGNIVGTIIGGKRPIAKLCIEHFCDVCGQKVKWE